MTAPTITLTTEEIRKACVAQFEAKAVAATVLQALPRPLADAEVTTAATLNVFSRGARGVSRARAGGKPNFVHTEGFMVVGAVTLAEGSDFDNVPVRVADMVDALEQRVFAAIFESPKFVRLGWVSYTVEKGTSSDGGAFRGDLRIEFELEWARAYEIVYDDEVNADDLVEVNAQYDLDGDGVHGPNPETETGTTEPRVLVDGLDAL